MNAGWSSKATSEVASAGFLPHGGQLQAAARRYGIPVAEWLDLSTGINPRSWPVPELPVAVWQRLPETEDGLQQAMQHYYGSHQGCAVAGSQAAIQQLPGLLFPDEAPAGIQVALLAPSYAEHRLAWQQAGFVCLSVTPDAIEACLQANPGVRALVLINPNNPTGESFASETLERWRQLLLQRQGWLLVDEAFMDATPEQSLIQAAMPAGLVVLRSLGKFFGLAGVRLGFVFAEPALLQRLQQRLGVWAVSHPARFVGCLALQDAAWQAQTRKRLKQDGERLADCLARSGLTPAGGTSLFQWVLAEQAIVLADALARQGVLVRCFEQPASLRFGLPATESDWSRLQTALKLLEMRA